jgi:SAM-dependent methyltransferase
MKRYDREYFQRWYHATGTRITDADALGRKVRFALGAAEFLLGRPVRRVLDVGCGEGSWRPVLRRLRPTIDYIGVDSSEYAVAKFGRRRNLRLGTFGHLDEARVRGRFDLVVCADVLQYVADADLVPGLAQIRDHLRGVAFIEAFTSEDDMEGDRDGWHERTTAQYRRAFRAAGLAHCGLNCFVNLDELPAVNAFELGQR